MGTSKHLLNLQEAPPEPWAVSRTNQGIRVSGSRVFAALGLASTNNQRYRLDKKLLICAYAGAVRLLLFEQLALCTLVVLMTSRRKERNNNSLRGSRGRNQYTRNGSGHSLVTLPFIPLHSSKQHEYNFGRRKSVPTLYRLEFRKRNRKIDK